MAPSKDVTVGELRKAVPDHCFRASALRSTAHIIVDLTLASTLAVIGYLYINQIETSPLRWLTWAAYGYLQGLFFVGIWILAHEGGHGALYSSNAANNAAGFVLHSVLMVPYFSWKYTHARHHRYHNHMEKDTAFVPHREGEKTLAKKVADMLGHTEDAPLYHLALLILHQTFGWQAYMLSYASGGSASTPGKTSSFILWNSHFNPEAGIWTKSQRLAILASTFGVAAVFIGLCILGTHIGMTNVLLLYGVPYMWVNNWLGKCCSILTINFLLGILMEEKNAVAITYLHHTHPDNQHFEADRWNYTDGALETVDRPFGFIGKHIFHGIIDCHVVHHLFP